MTSLTSLLGSYTFQIVALGSALLGVVSGVLGSFAVLRKQSLLGDGVSHAALPGVVIAFLLTGSKNTEILLLGALITGLLSTLIMVIIVKNSRVKFDSALAMTLAVFFGLGLVLLNYSQKLPNASQAGLNRFIYGQASTILKRDVIFMFICGIILLSIVALFWKEFKLLSFDPDYAYTLGYNTNRLNLFLSFLIVIASIIGIQTVGVILMSALLVAPAVAARQWSNRLGIMVLLASFFGALSGVVGTLISSSVSTLPTGPVIAVCITAIALFSILFAPGRGLLHRLWQNHKNRINFDLQRKKT